LEEAARYRLAACIYGDGGIMNAPARWHVLSNYGMLLVLLALCATFSLLTIQKQYPVGVAAAREVAVEIERRCGRGARVLILASSSSDDRAFADELRLRLGRQMASIVADVRGDPRDAREAFQKLNAGEKPDAVACTRTTALWQIVTDREPAMLRLGTTHVISPQGYYWPDFLKRDNLRNVANQITVIAIIAIGMTMVIITGGIDLSVGSLVALSAVVSTLLIRDWAGAKEATVLGMTLSCLAGIAICTLIGAFSGFIVHWFGVPSFIVTLAVMQIASGAARRLTNSESVAEVPDAFVWLGRGTWLGVPNQVLLMILLYVAAHVVMSRTTMGRYLYAVGGNPKAARLCGLPIGRVLLVAYAACAMLAGLGGVILASQLKSGGPSYGDGYELKVIAAVVVGGTSLSGGEGRMFGTLIGAFIIAVIENGMNLRGIDADTQQIVLGAVILGAVLLDKQKQRLWESVSGGGGHC
jgi:ribose transport system permease protein